MRRTPCQLWHLLSLDAPTVAALWTYFIARANHVPLPWQAPTAMFLAVWILYAADRLLDVRTSPSGALEERHRFHARHGRFFVFGIALASLALAALTPQLFAPALHLYALLGAFLTVYFLLIHTRVAGARRLPKEAAVGIFFALAIFIPTVARRPDLRPRLILPAALFGTLCTLNCMFLYAWEHPASRAADTAHATTRFLTRRLGRATLALVVACGLCLLFTRTTAICSCIAMSAILLRTLDLRHSRMERLSLRAYADLALLTPVAMLLFV